MDSDLKKIVELYSGEVGYDLRQVARPGEAIKDLALVIQALRDEAKLAKSRGAAIEARLKKLETP